MARTIDQIQTTMTEGLQEKFPDLSNSATAEWRLMTYVTAAVIHMFEVIMDLFRREVETKIERITPGTLRWYAEMAQRFQYGNGEKLTYDAATGLLYYENVNENNRIIKKISVTENERVVSLKVAKEKQDGELMRLDEFEFQSFKDYMNSISMAGIQVNPISDDSDLIRYNVTVYYDPTYSRDNLTEEIKAKLNEFKKTMPFNSTFYSQRLLEAIISVDGVLTVEPVEIKHKLAYSEYKDVHIMTELHAGYFNYDEESVLNLQSVKD